MAPSSPPTARKPTHLSVIHDDVFKKDSAIKARRLLTDAGKLHDNVVVGRPLHDNMAEVMDKAAAMSATASPGLPHADAWGGVERPEDICELSIDGDWDLDEAVFLIDQEYACEEDTAPADSLHLDTPPEGESVWDEADCFLRAASESERDLLELLEDNPVAARDFEEEAAGVWVAPQGFGF